MKDITETSISRNELETYIGNKAQNKFYKKALDTYFRNPSIPIWCFPSFFLGMFWFAYRKALTPTLILVTVTFVLNTFPITAILAILLYILLFFFLGLFGVNIFFSTAKKEIIRINNTNFNLDEKNILELIAKKGGTSNLYPTILYCSLVLLYFLLF